MAKRRLNNSMREQLFRKARASINPTKETAAVEKAYAKAAPLVRAVVEKKYPLADMDVLKKYNMARQDACIRLSYPNGVVQQFNFNENYPRVPDRYDCNNRIYLIDQKGADAVEAWADAAAALKAEKDKRYEAYCALINGTKYLEDLIESWPEIADMFPTEGGSLIPLNPDTIALIQKDMKERSKAA